LLHTEHALQKGSVHSFFCWIFSKIILILLKRNWNLFIIGKLSKINTHALNSICWQNGYQCWIISFHLINYELKGLSHCVFNHLFFGLFSFLETLVKILKNFWEKSVACVFHFLSDSYNSVLLNVNSSD